MVYYEPRVTQADKDYITLRLSQCVMKIRHDHGPYRHLRCYWPNDPIGSLTCMALQWASRTYEELTTEEKKQCLM